VVAVSRLRAVAAAALLALVVLILPGATVSAATPATFGTPTASGSLGDDIQFAQPVTLTSPIESAELLLTFADAPGPEVIPIPGAFGTGAVTLTYRLPTSGDAHILPNTPIVAQWRLIPSDHPDAAIGGPDLAFVYGDTRFTWKTLAGSIVRVHWYQGDDAFGQRALKIGEDAIKSSGALLGVTEERPVDFFIYADQQPFYDALGPGTRENVGGEAIAGIRTLFALITPNEIDDSWVGIVIPHELTHLVFDTAVHNPYHFPPRWLNEGLAVYVSQGYDADDRGAVSDAATSGSLFPLPGLTGEFPTSGDGFSLAYAESVSAIDYFVRTYGRPALVGLIRSYADGRTDDEAFQAAIHLDVAGFSDAWLADLHAKPLAKVGPVDAPAGPLPVAWGGSPAPQGNGSGSGGGIGEGPSPDGGASVGFLILAIALVVIIVFSVRRYRRTRG
jgi:Peptidase MA superfamily